MDLNTMGEKAQSLGKKLRLDSHHTAERLGVAMVGLGLVGTVLIGTTATSALMADRAAIAQQTIYNSTFTTSKTQLTGEVNGVYGNKAGDRVLIMMKFEEDAPISTNADDYKAFMMGSTADLGTTDLKTEGIDATFYVMGSTGYVGVLLEAEEPFEQQITNLIMRAEKELTRPEEGTETELDETDEAVRGGDSSFDQYDQWSVYVNPGAEGVEEIEAMEASSFDPTRAYYDIVVKDQEQTLRGELDDQLELMRADLQRADTYTSDLATTKVDGLFLRPPAVPKFIKGDEVTGTSASESDDDTSTLELQTDAVEPGGYDFDWRSGNVMDGYLEDIVPDGVSTSEFLNERNEAVDVEDTSTEDEQAGADSVSQMQWELSDGSSLTEDYDSSARTMEPLFTAMNNLSGAYESYAEQKTTYQVDMLSELLALDVDMRSVESNISVNDDDDFLTY